MFNQISYDFAPSKTQPDNHAIRYSVRISVNGFTYHLHYTQSLYTATFAAGTAPTKFNVIDTWLMDADAYAADKKLLDFLARNEYYESAEALYAGAEAYERCKDAYSALHTMLTKEQLAELRSDMAKLYDAIED